MDKKNTGKFIKELRIEKGLTQTEFSLQFSKFCGIDAYGGFSCAAISKWERGEALPDLYNLRDIAKFYGITIDEILEGRRHIAIDYNEIYFGEFNRKESQRRAHIKNNKPTPLEYFDGNFDKSLIERVFDAIKIQIKAENRYRRLLLALAHNTISRTDEDEFDFLCLSFFKQYYYSEDGKQIIKSFDDNNLKYIKIDIKKLANSIATLSDDELLFEINRRYSICNFMPMQLVSGGFKRIDYQQSCAIEIFYDEDLDFRAYFEFIKSLSLWDKDMLLIAAVDNLRFCDDEFLDFEESILKQFIKSLIDCGAAVNHKINYKSVLQNRPRYIAQELAELHQEYCTPTVVYDTTQKHYVELEHYSHAFGDPIFTADLKMQYEELKKRLLTGENELERQYSVIRGKSIYNITYREYMSGRDEQRTSELYKNISALSCKEIINDYFVEKESIQ